MMKKEILFYKAKKELRLFAKGDAETVFGALQSTPFGLSDDQIQDSRRENGVNKISETAKKSTLRRLREAFINPFTAILMFLAVVATVTDILMPIWQNNPDDFNPVTVVIIAVMVTLSGLLRFVQETRSGNAAEALLDLIITTCTVERQNGGTQEIALDDVVVGDVVRLSAGDMLPADVRILTAKDLFVSQAALTGESEPVEKTATPMTDEKESITDAANLAFMGTNVVSGTATAIVLRVGDRTLFGSLARSVATDPPETDFTKGVNSVSWVLIRFMLCMVPVVFFVNGLTKGDWADAFLFAISIAVGLTPEMLPMIVTTCLAKGAVAMSKKKTVVKNLNSLQSFGAMDVLCTDKTGTLTQNSVALEYHLDADGNRSSRVLRHAYLNSYFQTGYKNLMDRAIIAQVEEEEHDDPTLLDLSEAYVKVDEVPFDFARRRLSVVVADKNGKSQLITKGAVEEMLSVCTYAEQQGQIVALTDRVRQQILAVVDQLNDDGMRVIALAQKSNPAPAGAFGIGDERDMVLMGYLAFLDPPKSSAKDAITALKNYGVTTKILTGDNEKTTRCTCRLVGLPTDYIVLGPELEKMTPEELSRAVEENTIFAKLSPDQKAQIVTTLRENGHVTGFLGDGINDAPAMKCADIGISVNGAADIAKESADIILLEKSLLILEQGILEGRKTYANMIKYIKMTASSNFGNMFSVLAASALLPFLPMMSIHLILLNLIYDISCMAIPWDNVDDEFLRTPRTWNASGIGRFMVCMGPTSSVFDWLTYAVMYFILCPQFVSSGLLYSQLTPDMLIASGPLAGMDMQSAYEAMFQAGWFVESMWSQTLVIHMIRTPKLPFLQSRASLPLTALTSCGIAVLTLIPFTALGHSIGFVSLPHVYFYYLLAIVLAYMVLVTTAKKLYIRRYGSLL
jgi:Mg2+-importing ATPase